MMRASNNNTDNRTAERQQQLPLDFVPRSLRDAGLTDAHSAPLVGVRTAAGVRSFRTSPDRAWRRVDPYELLEWGRTGNSYPALVLDCDSRGAVELAHACSMSAGPLPVPNVTIARRESGHLHAAWFLRTPVHRGAGARAKPLTLFGRVAEYYRATLGADSGFVGVLSSNPVDREHFDTAWPRLPLAGYELRELARALPRGWRMPSPATTAAGRNVALFRMLYKRGLRGADEELRAIAHAANLENAIPMDRVEVDGIVKSVLRYRRRWRAQGHAQWFRIQQADLGRRAGTASGAVRRIRSSERAAAILTAAAAGAKPGELAARFGVTSRTVYRALSRVVT